MESKKTLQRYFEQSHSNTEFVIKYEENKNYFKELLHTGHKEDLEFVINIWLSNYINALILEGRYKTAMKEISDLELVLNKIKGVSEAYRIFYEGTLFLKGVNLRHLKKYKESNVVFREYITLNPTNDKAINWYKANLKSRITIITESVAFIGLFMWLSVIILNLTNYKINDIFLKEFGAILVLLSLISSFIMNGLINRKKVGF